MKFHEIETKYRADEIKMQDFISFLEEMKPAKKIQTGSHDYYYTTKADEDCFIRYRAGERPELTMKKKLADTNNFVRIEANLRLDPKVNAEERLATVSQVCSMLNFGLNFTIYKHCLIYYWDTFNVVYYIVYDAEMRERDRFIEVEMNESLQWESEEQAWNELVKIEKSLAPIGINSNRRIRKSLFEMFRRST